MSKTYTLAVTKTIVVATQADSLKEAHKKIDHDLTANMYSHQWQEARNKSYLIAVAVNHG